MFSTVLALFLCVIFTFVHSDCPTGTCSPSQTCCPLANGENGCCPYINAQCCSDHQHCCPNGFTCNVEKGECTKSSQQPVSIYHHVPPCPTGTCAPSSTCCKIEDGSFGCCPFSDAVCCTDGSHCCPSGYVCNLEKGTCVDGLGKVIDVKKFK